MSDCANSPESAPERGNEEDQGKVVPFREKRLPPCTRVPSGKGIPVESGSRASGWGGNYSSSEGKKGGEKNPQSGKRVAVRVGITA